MVLFRVDKVVVVALVDATKTTMEHVGAQRMELADRGVDDTRRLMGLYGDLRRLKDYLQRCVGAFRDRVDLDISAEDLPLLAGCVRRCAELTDQRMTSCVDLRERALLQARRELLIDWAVEFSNEPMRELPLPKLTAATSPAMRGMRTRISQKFAQRRAAGSHEPYIGPLQSMPSDLSGPLPDGEESTTAGASDAATGTAPALPAPAPAATATAEPAEPVAETAPLLEVARVHDPQLRAIMAVDLRSLERAIAASDFRLAAIHLTSVLEGALTDHAISRTRDLGLSNTPDAWNPQDVLLRVFGEACEVKDRAAAHQLFQCCNLIHPAQQLKTPIVVTALAFRKHYEFVGLALRRMGFTG